MGPQHIFDSRAEWTEARLALAVDLMREISRAGDSESMYQIFATRSADIFPTDLHLTISRRGLESPRVRVVRWSKRTDAPTADPMPVIEHGVLCELAASGVPTILNDLDVAENDPAFNFLDGCRSVLAVPLFDSGEPMEMLILARRDAGAFSANQLPDLVWLCNLFTRASQAAELAKRQQVLNEQNRHEMMQIARMQQALLPAELPKISTLDLGAFSRSTNMAGGDYYDVISLPRGRVGLLIADVCGHGASAAMLVAMLHSLVRTYTGPAVPPGHLLAYVNNHLTRMSTRSFGTFVTAVYAVYDPDKAILSWANAGHPPPRLTRADGNQIVLKGRRCVPLGIVDGTDYPADEVGLSPGDVVILHTDGVVDAKGPAAEPFGTNRLDQALATTSGSARAIIGSILRELEAFSGKQQDDDCTILALKFVRSRKKAGEISGEWRAISIP